MKSREMNRYARNIAARLLSHHVGDRDDPDTWVSVAQQIGCRVYIYCIPGGCLGEYAPTLDGDGSGVIQYNTAATPPAQARVICHESAHHLLWPVVPGYLFGEWVKASYDDDPLDVRHQIARMAEELCFRR